MTPLLHQIMSDLCRPKAKRVLRVKHFREGDPTNIDDKRSRYRLAPRDDDGNFTKRGETA